MPTPSRPRGKRAHCSKANSLPRVVTNFGTGRAPHSHLWGRQSTRGPRPCSWRARLISSRVGRAQATQLRPSPLTSASNVTCLMIPEFAAAAREALARIEAASGDGSIEWRRLSTPCLGTGSHRLQRSSSIPVRERVGAGLEAVQDALRAAQLARAHPVRQRRHRGFPAVHVIQDHEALRAGALAQQVPFDARPGRPGVMCVISSTATPQPLSSSNAPLRRFLAFAAIASIKVRTTEPVR